MHMCVHVHVPAGRKGGCMDGCMCASGAERWLHVCHDQRARGIPMRMYVPAGQTDSWVPAAPAQIQIHTVNSRYKHTVPNISIYSL